MKTYVRLIAQVLRIPHAEALRLLTEDERECLAVETIAAKAHFVQVAPPAQSGHTLFGVGAPL